MMRYGLDWQLHIEPPRNGQPSSVTVVLYDTDGQTWNIAATSPTIERNKQ